MFLAKQNNKISLLNGGCVKHEAIIRVQNLEKKYNVGAESGQTEILSDVNLEIFSTDFCIIYGPSGSGKSTLLHHLVGLEVPTKGNIFVRDTDITKLNPEQRAIFRSQKFGMIYQFWYWAKALNVVENVAMPLYIAGVEAKKAEERAMECLEDVGMAKYAKKNPLQLSGGEQQRATIARALINNPWIIIADEPTGNLDTHNADQVMQIFQDLNVHHRRTIIMVTHNLSYLPMANRSIAVKDGKVISSGVDQVKEQIRHELEGVI